MWFGNRLIDGKNILLTGNHGSHLNILFLEPVVLGILLIFTEQKLIGLLQQEKYINQEEKLFF